MPTELRRGLIVSCQAEGDSPFNTPVFMAAFARAAEMGGAVAVRVCGTANVRAVRAQVSLPIIGITKGHYGDGSVLITPGLDDVRDLIAAGADIVAMDATSRNRPSGQSGTDLVRAAVALGAVPIMADVSTRDEGVAAAAAGAALVGTTLAGYTPATAPRASADPDFDLLGRLCRDLPGRVIAEGRIWTPQQARRALALGAHAVVVGTAITRPIDIVRRFVEALEGAALGRR
jgi:putative N-acetylmannosamine-6-phosphate epimerase